MRTLPYTRYPIPNPHSMLLRDYDYELPPERIAQEPIEPRDAARLLIVPRSGGELAHRRFHDLPEYLEPNDLLVVNETRVSAVRLLGVRENGGAVEVLTLRPAIEKGADIYETLVKPGRRVRIGDILRFDAEGFSAEVLEITPDGGRILRFVADNGGEVTAILEARGRVPLPPYITAPLTNKERYQTVYAKTPGSAAAPTAGLHFTPELLAKIAEKGVGLAKVRLDVGLGTFRPIRTEDITQHKMHGEVFDVPEETAEAVNTCRGRVIAVGTTALRALETAGRCAEVSGASGRIKAATGETWIFMYPGFRFRAADGLITNFHQPHSTLLLLVAAFVGTEQMRRAYATALKEEYRFLSFGDAMLAT